MNDIRRLLPVAVAVLLVAPAAAQTGPSTERGPGFISADSPLYSIEVVVDNTAVAIGVMDAGDVAQERAAEAKEMQEKGNTKAAQRAAEAASEAVKAASSGSSANTAGIDKAIDTLNGIKKDAPDEAKDGLTTAVDSLKQARKIINGTASPSGTPPDGPGDANDTPSESANGSTTLVTNVTADGDVSVPSYCRPPTPDASDWEMPENCTGRPDDPSKHQ